MNQPVIQILIALERMENLLAFATIIFAIIQTLCLKSLLVKAKK
jgi:hypothetical protein